MIHPFGDHGGFGVDAPRIRVATRGDEEGEVHEQDDEAEGGADGDDDAFAGDGAVVGLLGGAAGGALAGVGGGGGADDGAVREVGGAVAAVAVGVVRVPPEVRLGAHAGEEGGDAEAEPEQEVAGDVGAGGHRSVAAQEHEDVGAVPHRGEAEGDEFPGQEPDVVAVGPVVVGVVVVVVDVVREDDLVGQRPADEADADEGEDDGQGPQAVFPEKCGVVGVHFPARGTDGEHDFEDPGKGELLQFEFFFGVVENEMRTDLTLSDGF